MNDPQDHWVSEQFLPDAPNLTRQDGSAFDRLIASRLDLSATPSRDTDSSPPHPPTRGESS